MSDLKACPCCGSEAEIHALLTVNGVTRHGFARCSKPDCCKGPTADGVDAISEAWNTRHITQQQVDDYLAAKRLVAVQVEPFQEAIDAILDEAPFYDEALDALAIYRAMIAAAKEKNQ